MLCLVWFNVVPLCGAALWCYSMLRLHAIKLAENKRQSIMEADLARGSILEQDLKVMTRTTCFVCFVSFVVHHQVAVLSPTRAWANQRLEYTETHLSYFVFTDPESSQTSHRDAYQLCVMLSVLLSVLLSPRALICGGAFTLLSTRLAFWCALTLCGLVIFFLLS